MKIAIACDHGGYDLKTELSAWLTEQGHQVEDFGCFNRDSCDYADFAGPAVLTRRHNDANLLALGAGVVGPLMARQVVQSFLTHDFEGGRHQRRIDKIAAVEDE